MMTEQLSLRRYHDHREVILPYYQQQARHGTPVCNA